MNQSVKQVKQENFTPDVSFNGMILPNSNTMNMLPDDIEAGKKKRAIPFWSENPNILLDQRYIFEFFPIETMSHNQKLNAVTRTIILLTILGFAISQNIRLLFIGVVIMGAIYIIHYYHTIEKDKVNSKKEGFLSVQASELLAKDNIQVGNDVFQEPDSSNPFSNVMMPDYDYNPNKKPAPPAFNQNINTQILQAAKQLVLEANPDQPDIADKLFTDLGENLVFEQSMRQFSSNPATTIPNDQGAFAEFCYGSMISCKEGNNFACARNLPNYTLY
jgi:hypothetical protein